MTTTNNKMWPTSFNIQVSSCQGIEFAFYYKVDMLTLGLSRVFALVSYDMDVNQLCHLSHEVVRTKLNFWTILVDKEFWIIVKVQRDNLGGWN
jgi:hypothetical protein